MARWKFSWEVMEFKQLIRVWTLSLGAINIITVRWLGHWGGAVASWLVHSTPDLAVWV